MVAEAYQGNPSNDELIYSFSAITLAIPSRTRLCIEILLPRFPSSKTILRNESCIGLGKRTDNAITSDDTSSAVLIGDGDTSVARPLVLAFLVVVIRFLSAFFPMGKVAATT
jgi:hypothetical protein